MTRRSANSLFLSIPIAFLCSCTEERPGLGGDAGVDTATFDLSAADGPVTADGPATTDGPVPADAGVDRQPVPDLARDQLTVPDLWVMPDLGPLGDDFALIVPVGSQACAQGRVNAADLPRTLAGVAQVRFNPAAVRLPITGALPTVDLIHTLEVGLDRRQATSLGPGTLSYSFSGSEQWGTHGFVYEEDFDVDGTTVTLWWQIPFRLENGVPTTQTKTVSDQALFEGEHQIQLRWPTSQPTSYLGACTLSRFCSVRAFTLDGQDTLTVEICSYCPQHFICKSDPSIVLRARFASGGDRRDVVDPLRLAHSNRHHNWGEDMLVFFDQPLGQVHGVYLGTDPYPSGSYGSASYLDAALQTVRTVTCSDPRPGTF